VSAEARLAELGIELPAPHAPAGSYVAAKIVGDLLYVSGQGPQLPDGTFITGKVSSAEQGYEAARVTGLSVLAVMRDALRSLDRVAAIVKLLGMVNVAEGFDDTPGVINGCSDLLVAVFGDAGRHARSAVGMAALPFGLSVEIEVIAQITQG
jgi:enamine deaminase RidA (YjgF/YER057c/UK114 family)